MTCVPANRFLPLDRTVRKSHWVRLDAFGTRLLAIALLAYTLAMTVGHCRFSPLNIVLLPMAAVGVALFVLVERRVASPLIRLATFRTPPLAAVAAGMRGTFVVAGILVLAALCIAVRAQRRAPAGVPRAAASTLSRATSE